MKNLIIQATPIMRGEDVIEIKKELMRTPSKKNKERQKFLLEILDRVTS